MRNLIYLVFAWLVLCRSVCVADQFPCGKPKPEWSACESDADCVVGEAACYDRAGFNKSYITDVKNYNTCIRPMIRCRTPESDDKEKTVALCRFNNCEAAKPAAKHFYFQELNRNVTEGLRVPEQWSSCDADNVCILLRGVCGSWITVNKQSEQAAADWVRQRQAEMSCVIVNQPTPTKLSCRSGLCDFELTAR